MENEEKPAAVGSVAVAETTAGMAERLASNPLSFSAADVAVLTGALLALIDRVEAIEAQLAKVK